MKAIPHNAIKTKADLQDRITFLELVITDKNRAHMAECDKIRQECDERINKLEKSHMAQVRDLVLRTNDKLLDIMLRESKDPRRP